jgi:Domain of unknown function (DUF1707)
MPAQRRPMTPRTQLRAADADRQAVADRLLRALEEGRLDLLEYDDRLARAYRSVTYGELTELLADLPAQPPSPVPPSPVPPRPVVPAARSLPRALRVLWTIWLSVVSVNLCVWLLVSIGNGRPDTFWPMWLAVPGAVLFAVTTAGRALRRDGG